MQVEEYPASSRCRRPLPHGRREPKFQKRRRLQVDILRVHTSINPSMVHLVLPQTLQKTLHSFSAINPLPDIIGFPKGGLAFSNGIVDTKLKRAKERQPRRNPSSPSSPSPSIPLFSFPTPVKTVTSPFCSPKPPRSARSMRQEMMGEKREASDQPVASLR